MAMELIRAMAREEGFGVPNGRSTRNNNPGDIEWGTFAQNHGADRIESVATGKKARFAHFPDVESGFEAMRSLLKLHYSGMTVAQALNKYAPPVENVTNIYISNVCKWVGCTPETIIDTLL